MKKIKMVALALSICLGCAVKTPVYAQEYDQMLVEAEDLNGELPDGWIIDDMGNYSNLETGEYFKWVTNERGSVAKKFEFYIRYSVTSPKFIVDSTSVTIKSSAHLVDKYGVWHSKEGGFKYQIHFSAGLFGTNLNFNTEGKESGVINNLTKGGSYTIRIGTGESLPYDKDGDELYLEGNGTVTNN